ncbi:MAG: methionyl-tRNA formyltransferase [Verrucomicrobiales bacterium]|nr:methionyl-tRNA formyltransferase [Verrucomicrobiales bacterium]
MPSSLKIVFMGAGEIALPTLRALIETQPAIDIAGVYTQPDKRVGRKQLITPPAIKVVAEEAGIPVFQPETLRKNEAALEEFSALDCDLAIVMAYGQILPRSIIEAPKIACINLHASLLPRHRGASPIQAAIRDGDAESGITLMHIVPKLDAGDMILKKTIPIEPTDTGGVLHDKLADLGPALLREAMPLFEKGSIKAEPQEEDLVTYSGKLEREHGEIDWTLPAAEIELLIRAYDPWPGTYTTLPTEGGPKKLKIYPQSTVLEDIDAPAGTVVASEKDLTVACGDGALKLNGDLQLEGRKRLDSASFLNGIAVKEGTILGTS